MATHNDELKAIWESVAKLRKGEFVLVERTKKLEESQRKADDAIQALRDSQKDSESLLNALSGQQLDTNEAIERMARYLQSKSVNGRDQNSE